MTDYADSPAHDARQADLKIEALESLLADFYTVSAIIDMMVSAGAVKGVVVDHDAMQDLNDSLVGRIIDLNNERKRNG